MSSDDSILAALSGFSGGVKDVILPYLQTRYKSSMELEQKKAEIEAQRNARNITLNPEVSTRLGLPGGTRLAPEELTAMTQVQKPHLTSETQYIVDEKGNTVKTIIGKPGEKIGVTKIAPTMVPILDENGDIKGYAPKGSIRDKPPTQSESTNATYANRIEQANAIFDRIEPKITKMSTVGLATQRTLPNWLQIDDMQSQTQAERNFLNATLRRESGAVISPSEFEEGRKQYFPQPGDSKKVLKQKKQNRLTVQKTFIKGAGKAYTPATLEMPDVNMGIERTADDILKQYLGGQ